VIVNLAQNASFESIELKNCLMTTMALQTFAFDCHTADSTSDESQPRTAKSASLSETLAEVSILNFSHFSAGFALGSVFGDAFEDGHFLHFEARGTGETWKDSQLSATLVNKFLLRTWDYSRTGSLSARGAS
jgi:hypothetical protein